MVNKNIFDSKEMYQDNKKTAPTTTSMESRIPRV